MKDLRISIDSESFQYVVFDDDNKVKTMITKEVIQDIEHIESPNNNDVKNFYNNNYSIVLKNKSKEPNSAGFYESKITTLDF